MADSFKLPAMHYWPRSFDQPWSPAPLGDYTSRPTYVCVGGEPVVFCLCGRVRDVALSSVSGGYIDNVSIQVAPLHSADGNALLTLVRRAGYHERGKYGLYIYGTLLLIRIL